MDESAYRASHAALSPQLTLSSATVEKVREPRVVLALHHAEHGAGAEGATGKPVTVELSAGQLDEVVSQLEAAAAAVHTLAPQ